MTQCGSGHPVHIAEQPVPGCRLSYRKAQCPAETGLTRILAGSRAPETSRAPYSGLDTLSSSAAHPPPFVPVGHQCTPVSKYANARGWGRWGSSFAGTILSAFEYSLSASASLLSARARFASRSTVRASKLSGLTFPLRSAHEREF
eukprot:scaffold990_cov393-Prasinococcus_capsulatus_cf.AAC.41